MTQRTLYIAAYDVSDQRRLREALKLLKGYASGRQKSVFECFLTMSERRDLLDGVHAVLDADEDRFVLLRLDARGKVRTLGKAVKPVDPPWFYVG
jgi:CRISPR-associated protein Cas2